nr:MAG TPA: hypothetical protein [Caudoviricetes sp.]
MLKGLGNLWFFVLRECEFNIPFLQIFFLIVVRLYNNYIYILFLYLSYIYIYYLYHCEASTKYFSPVFVPISKLASKVTAHTQCFHFLN